MPSREVYSLFLRKGYDLTGSYYNRLDTLESNDDLLMLYDVLSSNRGSQGSPPVITANMVVGNPDFEKIEQSQFENYYFEPTTETLKRYSGRDKVEELWRQGNDAGIFFPQFHGREHVNVVRWLKALRKRTPGILFSFENRTTFSGEGDYNFMEVLDYDIPEDLDLMKNSLIGGAKLFESIFGFRSKSFIPPCYTWSEDIEATLHSIGVKYLQGLMVQLIPTGSFGKYRKRIHFLGNRSKSGQYYLTRNCYFEPALSGSKDPVGDCLNRIRIAFNWHKPAIICTHRINYTGSLDQGNRSRNLALLNELLGQINKNWPQAEYMTSVQLGDLIADRL